MATVTRKFKEQFDIWAARKIANGDFTNQEMEDLKALLRKDFTPGPDQLRAGLTFIKAAGVEVPATIDDHEERYRVWDEYFASENQLNGYGQMAA
jgi:hypothetical protein